MRELGPGHIDQMIEAMKRRKREDVEDLERLQQYIQQITGSRTPTEFNERAEQDQKVIHDFLQEKFGRFKTADEAVEVFTRDPRLWRDLLNALLYRPVKAPDLLKLIREQHKKPKEEILEQLGMEAHQYAD